jgi:hypothetical protein
MTATAMIRRLVLPVLLFVGVLVALPSAASAQCPQSVEPGQVVAQGCTPDITSPTVTITPASGSYTSASLSVTIEWCDDQSLNSGSKLIKLNGVPVSGFGYTTGSKSGCGKYASSTGTVTLASGSNTLYAEIADTTGNVGSKTATYTYTPATTYGVSVTPDGLGVTKTANTATSYGFTVQNTGNASAVFNLTKVCSNGPTNCSVPATSTVAAGASGTATVSFTAGAAGSSGPVQLTATHSTNTSTTNAGSITVNVASANAPTVTLSPTGGSYTSNRLKITITDVGGNDLNMSSRTMTLNGTSVKSSFNYTQPQSGGETILTQATDTGTVTLAPGSNSFVAQICDVTGLCGTGSGTYTYVDAPPTVSFGPPSGTTFSQSNQHVVITWSDDKGLNAASRSVTFNGVNVTTPPSATTARGRPGHSRRVTWC